VFDEEKIHNVLNVAVITGRCIGRTGAQDPR